jgi:hypothetical protein
MMPPAALLAHASTPAQVVQAGGFDNVFSPSRSSAPTSPWLAARLDAGVTGS